jgi:hypothetical protein
MSYDASNHFELGLFPHLAPTLRVDTSFFHKSFNLFSVDLGDVSFYDDRSTPRGQKLFTKETAISTTTLDGTPVTYVQASDHIEIRDMGDIASVESVVLNWSGTENKRFVDPQFAPGISGATLNMTGISPNSLANTYQSTGQGHGVLLGQSNLDLHMTNGKTVRIFLGTGL